MKKVILLATCAVLALVGCNTGQKTNPADLQNDSLRSIIQARDNEINDMMGTLNDIQQGFADINAAENRVTVAKDGEGADKGAVIKENIEFIAQRMKENRELIKKLQDQLRETGFKGDQMTKAIQRLQGQLVQKDNELKKLRAELQAKNIHIAELDETIDGLNSDVASLNTSVKNLNTDKQNLTQEKERLLSDNTEKAQTISTQDKQLNTAWYVFGTKKELKAQNILSGGKVLREGFNRNYFTKIDIRVNKEIKLYSKSAKVLTNHPTNSYSLQKDTNGQYVLRISDPDSFWSTSKYLVVQVK